MFFLNGRGEMSIVKKLFKREGFTLVEIMIVIAIIGLLAAVAIPNFVRARETAQKNACISNLKQIDGAKTLWSLDTGSTATPTWTDLVTAYIKQTPSCPTGASYTIGALGSDPTCNSGVATHQLP
ncbi:protein containing Prepilin-type cleavage/methylation [Candidatus Omnitrophus magneticus]|uniref:Protein containing Prepilin-type cleavage/methylation n=1 Tax=Candidatus Omnitrophus magneticus TaxID=1609969 RepID=A0A0F0CK64_9BACT|nr:protein containing Prepilin-type cleavage/methylation [Candidatus Omnitrophus magneticus]